MGKSEHRRQRKLAAKARERKEHRKTERQRATPTTSPLARFKEGRDSYVKEYHRVIALGMQEHKSLLRVAECNDAVFFDMDTKQKLQRFNLAQYSEVLLATADDFDFTTDPTTSASGQVNVRERPVGIAMAGCTSIVENGGQQRSIILMRGDTGTKDSEEVKAATKLGTLLHEFGHVDDYERQINYQGKQMKVIDAEVYAHHHACRKLMAGESSFVAEYRQAVSPHYTPSTRESST